MLRSFATIGATKTMVLWSRATYATNVSAPQNHVQHGTKSKLSPPPKTVGAYVPTSVPSFDGTGCPTVGFKTDWTSVTPNGAVDNLSP